MCRSLQALIGRERMQTPLPPHCDWPTQSQVQTEATMKAAVMKIERKMMRATCLGQKEEFSDHTHWLWKALSFTSRGSSGTWWDTVKVEANNVMESQQKWRIVRFCSDLIHEKCKTGNTRSLFDSLDQRKSSKSLFNTEITLLIKVQNPRKKLEA